MSVENIYVIHYTKLTERRLGLNQQFAEHGMDKCNVTWLDQFDREQATQELYDEWYRPNTQVCPILPVAIFMNYLAHMYGIEHAKVDGVTMIIEDDIILKNNFKSNIEKVLAAAPANWDMIIIGGNAGIEQDKIPVDDISVIDPVGATPNKTSLATCCYLLNNSGARKILGSTLTKPFFWPIDDALCYITAESKCNVYWSKPFLAYEGSKSGRYERNVGVPRW